MENPSVPSIVAGMPEAMARPSLRAQLLNAGAWSALASISSQFLRFGSSLVLTRLLFPEAYGLYALVMTYVTGITMFSDIGLSSFLFQSARAGDRKFDDVIWSVGIVRGVLVALIATGAAYPMAVFYGQPKLCSLLLVASIAMLVSPLTSTKITVARRDLRYRELAIYGFANHLASVVLVLLLGWWFRSVWALVIGGVLGSAVQALSSQLLFPGPRNRWRWDRRLIRELRGFSRWIYGSSVMTFLGAQADRLILGKLMPMEFLGIYGIAQSLPQLALSMVQMGAAPLPSVIVQLRHRSDLGIQRKMQEARRLLLGTGVLLAAGVCVASPAFFALLYDPRYSRAGTIGALLAVGIWASILEASLGDALLAFGDARGAACCSMARLAGSLVGATGGYLLGGIYGLMVGLSFGSGSVYALSVVLLRRHGIRIGWSDARYCLAFVCLAGLGWGCALIVRRLKPEWSITPSSTIGAVVVALAWLMYEREHLRYFGHLGWARVRGRIAT